MDEMLNWKVILDNAECHWLLNGNCMQYFEDVTKCSKGVCPFIVEESD